jgi:hypothetical protein
MQALKSFLEWLLSEKSLGSATWALVLATFFLVLDGWQKSREQNRQWEEERKRKKEESIPSAVVEIAAKEETLLDMCFAVFNLGTNTFFVDRMIVTALDGARSDSDLTPQVVTPGTWVTIDYDPAQLLGVYGEKTEFKEAYCVLVLKGAFGSVTTSPEWFYFGYGQGRAMWQKGRLAERKPGLLPVLHKILRTPKGERGAGAWTGEI